MVGERGADQSREGKGKERREGRREPRRMCDRTDGSWVREWDRGGERA